MCDPELPGMPLASPKFRVVLVIVPLCDVQLPVKLKEVTEAVPTVGLALSVHETGVCAMTLCDALPV